LVLAGPQEIREARPEETAPFMRGSSTPFTRSREQRKTAVRLNEFVAKCELHRRNLFAKAAHDLEPPATSLLAKGVEDGVQSTPAQIPGLSGALTMFSTSASLESV